MWLKPWALSLDKAKERLKYIWVPEIMPFLNTNSHMKTKPYNFDLMFPCNTERYDRHGCFGTKFRGEGGDLYLFWKWAILVSVQGHFWRFSLKLVSTGSCLASKKSNLQPKKIVVSIIFDQIFLLPLIWWSLPRWRTHGGRHKS